jgi:hypothetical protein
MAIRELAMHIRTLAAAFVLMTPLAACAPSSDDGGEGANVRAFASLDSASSAAKTSGGPLIDHGGTVLATSKTYAVYWGPQSGFPGDLENGMAALLSGFDASAWLGVTKQYMRGAAVTTSYAGTILDSSAPPVKAPSTSSLGAEICKLVPSPDPSALYIVFTSNAPKVNYCAWHDKATCNGVTFQVAYVPNQAQLPGCSPYTRTNLGCNTYSAGTVSSADSVAHEFAETITDAHIDAWLDKNGQEIGDKCNFVYQGCVPLSTGSWQIQSLWSNAVNGCAQQ